MRFIDEIILHIIDSDKPSHDNVETIRQWHLERGFKDIGYHIYVNRKGEEEEGRPLTQIGAHTFKHNLKTIGVATFGKFKTERLQAQVEGVENLIIKLKGQYPAITKVSQHSNYDGKKPHCAGFTKSQMEYFNSLVSDNNTIKG